VTALKLRIELRYAFLFFACLAAGLLPILKAQTKQPPLSQEPPLWSIKPKQAGYPLSTYSHPGTKVGRDRVKIQFLDDQRLALAWVTRDQISEKPVGPANDVPSHLHLAIFDAHTGHQIGNHEWPCSSFGVDFAYTASGQWLLLSDQTVTLYSSSFDEVRDLDNVRTESRGTFISASGRTFLTRVQDSHGAWSAQLRDSSSFEVLDSWNDARSAKFHLTYSDHFILGQIINSPQFQNFYLRKVGGEWKSYSISVPSSHPPGKIGYGFVNDVTVAAFSGPQLALETVEGVELLNTTLPEDNLFLPTWSATATSTGGERFAVILDRLRGIKSPTLDLYPVPSEDRVVVYSVSKRSAIYSVKLRGTSWWVAQTHPVWNVIALSPDGQLLGIVSDEGVRVYVLPSGG
jgi:hypothetical protein